MHFQSFLPLSLGLAATTALAGHSSRPTHTGPGMLLTGCPNGYTDIATGECKPFHLRLRDADSGAWGSHKVTNVYRTGDHPWGPGSGAGMKPGDAEWKDWAKKHADGKDGKAKHPHAGPPSDHCPNGVANHKSGECHPFKVHARDAATGQWREHKATGAYHLPDEKPGMGAHFGGAQHGGAQHGGAMFGGAQQGGAMFGGAQHGGKGGFGGQHMARDALPEALAEAMAEAEAEVVRGGPGFGMGGFGGPRPAHGPGFGGSNGAHRGPVPQGGTRGGFGGPGGMHGHHARDALPEALAEAQAEAMRGGPGFGNNGHMGGFGGPAHGGPGPAHGGFGGQRGPMSGKGGFGGPAGGHMHHAREALPEAEAEAEAMRGGPGFHPGGPATHIGIPKQGGKPARKVGGVHGGSPNAYKGAWGN